jgi:hypothetical protein
MGSELMTGFDCRVCGEHHASLPLSFSVKAPHAVQAVPASQFAERVVITPDQCVIDGTHFYLRGRIVVPMHDFEEPFIWGVWAQVGAKDFYRMHKLWTASGREAEPAFEGRLASDLSLFARTLGLAVEVQTQPVGRRPHLLVRDAQHPLGAQQRKGLTIAEATEIAALLLHT